MRRILCLHLPYLATERARRDAGLAAEPPPLVLARPVGAALVVEQVCPAGARAGVQPGWSLGQAQALVPELLLRAHDPAADRAALLELADWAVCLSPIVEAVEPNALLVDITGCELLFGGEVELARQAAAGLAQRGFTVRAAIADTVGAAYALSSEFKGASSAWGERVGRWEGGEVGKEGGARDPRNGSEETRSEFNDWPVYIVSPGQTVAHLAPLPPSALRIEPHVSERLAALGVRTIGDLLMLPRAALPARFGPGLVQRLQQALGETFEGVNPHVPRDVPQAGRRFDGPVADTRFLLHVAAGLLDEVLAELHRRGAGLRRLDCHLFFETRPPAALTVALARATRAADHVLRLLAEKLEGVDWAAGEEDGRTPGAAALRLVAGQTSPWRAAQGDLFVPRDPGHDEALGGLIDRLAGRLGYEAVVRPRRIDDHQPEMAYRYVSVADAGIERAGIEGLRDSGIEGADRALKGARPLRLLVRPIVVRAIALVPDGPPTWFHYRGREHVIVGVRGPERIETAWWRGPDVRRDYFQVTTAEGEEYWLFRQRDEERWYVHGVFA